MVKSENNIISRLLSVLLAFSIVISLASTSVITIGAADNDADLGTIETLISGGTVNGNEVTFSGITLNWVAKNSLRQSDGWWVGIKVNAPDLSEDVLKEAKYTSSGTEKSFWSAKDSKEGDDVHYIELWGLVNEGYINDAISGGKNIVYHYEFDWNGDGTFEQPVDMIVEPAGVTLLNDEYTVYPSSGENMASVEAITGGLEVKDDQSNIVIADHTSGATLIKSEANEAIGRSEGWWVGIKVNAPAALKAESDFEGVNYQTNGGGVWSDPKSFWTNKDSADDANSHNIQLWGLVNESYILNAAQNNKVLNYKWRFDWDGDGVYEQLVHLKVDPAKVTLKDTNGEQVYPYLGTITPLTGGTVTGNTSNLTLNITETTLSWSAANTESGRNSDGWWVGMKVNVPEGYTEDVLKNAKYKRRVSNSQNGSGWSEYTDVDFWTAKDGEDHIQMWMVLTPELLAKYQAIPMDVATEYVFDWEGDGTYDQTITMKVVPSDKIVLNMHEDGVLKIEAPTSIKYSQEPQEGVLGISGASADGTLTYSVVAGDEYASVDASTGAINTKKPGGPVVIGVKDTAKGYSAYAEVTFAVERADQTGFGFTIASPEAVTYDAKNNVFTNVAEGGESDGAVTYEIVTPDSEDVASIDDNGNVTIKSAGEITIKATKAGNECYNAAEATYTLKIERAEADFSVEDIGVTYGEADVYDVDGLKIDIKESAVGTGAYSYSVEENDIGLSVTADGVLMFAESEDKVGTATVTITKAEDSCYNEKAIEVPVTVSYLTTDAAPTVDGEKEEWSEWYKGDITVKAPAGYQIAETNSLSAAWLDEIVFSSNDDKGVKTVYLKSSDGNGITDAIELKGLLLDKTAPADLSITYSTRSWEKILEVVTFGYYDPAAAVVTLTAKDAEYGMHSFTFNFGDEQTTQFVTNDDGSVSYTATISDEFRGHVSFTAMDKAGNTAKYEDGEMLVVDFTSPEIEVSYTYDGKYTESDDIIYTNNNVKATFEIKESNFDLSAEGEPKQLPVVVLNDNTLNVEWKYDADKDVWVGSCSITAVTENKLSVKYADLSGNQMNDYTKEIRIDKTNPVVDISYEAEPTPIKDSIYNDSRKATVTISERNFNAADVVLKVEAKDVTGATVDISAKAYAEYAKIASNWKTVGDVHTLDLDFDIDGVYTVDIEYTDRAGDAAPDYEADSFTIDTTSPAEPEIIYEDELSFIEKVIDSVTLGYYFYGDTTTVTVVVDDVTSGIDYINYSYTKEAESSDKILPGSGTVKAEDIVFSNDGRTATATFDIPAQARGSVTVEAVDNASNSSEKDDDKRINVVDDIAPGISVEYIADSNTQVHYYSDLGTLVDNFAAAKNAQYNGNVTAKIVIDEANFFEGEESSDGILHNVGIKLTKTDNSKKTTVVEYLPNGSEPKYADVEGITYEDITWTTEGDVHTATIVYDSDADYVLDIEYVDYSNNVADVVTDDGTTVKKNYTSKTVTVDKTAPIVTVEYLNDNVINDIDGVKYYGADQSIKVTVIEHNFISNYVNLSVTAEDVQGTTVPVYLNGKSYALSAKDSDMWTEATENTYEAVFEFATDARYTFDISCSDLAYNVYDDYTSDAFVVDHKPATDVTVTYEEHLNFWDKVLDAVTLGYYSYDDTLTVTITADDITAGVDYIEYGYVKEDGSSEKNIADFDGVDKTEELTYTNGGKTAQATFDIPAQARGYVTANVVDRSGNETAVSDETRINVVDTIAPTISVEYAPVNVDNTEVQFVDADKKTVDNFEAATTAYYNGDVTAKIVIDEANFFEGVTGSDGVIHNVGVKLTKTDDNGETTVIEYLPEGATALYPDADESKVITWTTEGDIHTATIEYSEDADYVLEIEYVDYSNKEAEITANDGNKATEKYTSKVVTVDKTAPVVTVDYANKDVKNTIDGREYYDAAQKATITVVEHNFRAADFAATVTAKDIVAFTDDNATASNVAVDDIVAILADETKWTNSGNTHTITIEYSKDAKSVDANYTFDYEYVDLAKNAAAEYEEDLFTVDTTVPELTVTYETGVIDKIIETITFGFYSAETTVTITATDDTAGVHSIEYSYTKQAGSSEKNVADFGQKIEEADITYDGDENKAFGKIATITFKIPAEARGYVTANAIDRSGNTTEKKDEKDIKVVDTIDPEISIEYLASEGANVQFITENVDGNGKEVFNTFAEAENAYYNGNVTAQIVIDEANFFEGKEETNENGEVVGIIHEIGVKLTKTDDNGETTVTEYLPEGATALYPDADESKVITWTTEGDIHTATIEYSEDADYVLEIEYVDYSENESNITAEDQNPKKDETAEPIIITKSYKSKVVTVDKTAPVVTVEYSNDDVKNTIDGRDYFDAVQSATITVEEHNFRAYDFAAAVTAKDANGIDVEVEDFAAKLADITEWKQSGNIYTITINCSVNANYTFGYEYTDLAGNAAAKYTDDSFAVDTVAPTMSIIYETEVSFWKELLKTVTFGYYSYSNDTIVTIAADDITAGVDYIEYSYTKEEGSSDINVDSFKGTIKAKDIVYADDNGNAAKFGSAAIATFTIPTQARGHVEAKVVDRAGNSTDKFDKQRINVVDNIAPTATITYNTPVRSANNISYYAGNIDATIVIEEANFYSEDVVVSVTKDGVNYPVNVAWVDNSVDEHTGTFTLTQDGDYIVNITYADRSANAMTEYTSNRLTIDTTAPTVKVSSVKNHSANKDDVYGFTVTANDINIDSETVVATLTATVKKEDGSYGIKEISLGELKTVEVGKTYSFTVDNLEEDAIYTLVCTLRDMSGNEYSRIILDDGNEYDSVRFSVNRLGSTFALGADTQAVVDQYYVYSVEKDLFIEEINVDPVEKYVVRLNGEVLTEGEDYTTTISNKEGEWSKRSYFISKDLFEEEGEYSIVVESVDKTDTTAYSDVKNVNLSFVVDQTAPVLTISGLESGGRYQIDEQTVTVIPTDDGGRLYSMKVLLLDSDGAPLKDDSGKDISVRFDMSGEEFLTYLSENDGKVIFTIPDVLEGQVQIICNDCAVDSDGSTNEYNETFDKVTVSQSGWIIFYANKPVFYGTIAGIVLLIAAIVALIVFMKRKKGEKNK